MMDAAFSKAGPMGKSSGFLSRLRAFGRATGANVAMMFGLAMLPLALATSAGIDFANAMMARNQMMDALDAAALALGAQNTLDSASAKTLAQKVFDANYKGHDAITINPQVSGQKVMLTATDHVPTSLLSMAGKTSLSIYASSTVVWGQAKLWVALVLDNTGSMSQTDSTGTSKISALKTATHSLLDQLKVVSANPGDVKVAIIPFAKDVKFQSSAYTTPNDTSWVDWTDWDSSPTGYGFSTPGSSVGYGSNCPYSFGCVTAAGGGSSASKIASSGLICPGTLGSSTPGGSGHHFQGCYDSVPSQTATTTTVNVIPVSVQYSCSELQSDLNKQNPPAPTCTLKSSTDGNPTSSTSNTVYTNGYTGSSGPTTTSSTVNGTTYTDGGQNCTGNPKNCKWTRTYTNTRTDTIITATAYNFSHTWTSRAHSYWTGCIMDRGPMAVPAGDVPGNDYDTNAGASSPWVPNANDASSRFPAEINDSCPVAMVMPLTYVWDSTTDTSPSKNQNLYYEVESMQPNGGTNQGVGVAQGMQALTNTVPYNPGEIPGNTTKYIILLSDGLNTLDRWYGDGSNQSTSVDTREKAACDNAKSQGFNIYTVFVDLGGTQGSSSALLYCAGSKPGVSDPSMYFDLTTSGAIVTTFNLIASKIGNLRVAG